MLYALHSPASNRLLASLPTQDSTHLAAFLRTERPPQGCILIGASEPVIDVWFPHSGAIALITTDAAGRSVQTGMVGREGCIGLQALLGDAKSAADAVVQIEGAVSVISAAHLRTALDRLPSVLITLARFLQRSSVEATQTIVCNRLHSLLSRCCRWLLTLHDHANGDDLPITQEGLAALLGGGRPRVNLLLATLQQQGIVRRHRGRIQVMTRAGLERYSCECYHLIRDVAEPASRLEGRVQTVTPVTDN
jgi:CRP-like cAMP-binding protein